VQLFSRLSEQRLRQVRWVLLIGWLLLIASLLLPAISLPLGLLPSCPAAAAPDCPVHRQPGNRIFWGTVVPAGLLLIGAASHEIWRRICPLAFVSQLARALGWQHSRPGRKGKPEVVMVESNAWLARHHLTLQWSLLIAGLSLRLLAVNGSPLGLAILLLFTLAAALLVGWAWGGKAWCQYICPMGPVQTVLTGLRGPLGSQAHVGTSAKITQSMCRTIGNDGREQSACVACQTPCLDIDAERAFWQTLRGKRGLSWIWLSYPGLILAFFLLMDQAGAGSELATHPLGYLRSGLWAFDLHQPQRIGQSLWPGLPLPRLIEIPLLLTAAAVGSQLLFRALESLLHRLHLRQGLGQPEERAIQRTRLIASFVALNSFAWFVDPFQGAVGPGGAQLLRSAVLLATGIGLARSWGRDQATYRRESLGESLRRQLRDLPGLEAALDGRSLEALSPQEVFTLVKAIPAFGRRQGRATYRAVMADMLRSGRLARTTALLELQDLRESLQLEEADHHAVVRDLAREEPDLLRHDHRQRQIDELRRVAATDAIRDLLQVAGMEVLLPERLPPALHHQLEHLRAEIRMDPPSWQDLLQAFGPQGEREQRRLEELRQSWLHEAGLAARLEQLAVDDGLLRPLHLAMQERLKEVRIELAPRLAASGLEPLPLAVPAAEELEQVFDLLWQDPDPDTAGWVLMLARERDPQRASRYRQEGRPGQAESSFLLIQRRGDIDREREEYAAVTAASLFHDLLPRDVVWVVRQGHLVVAAPGERLITEGETSDFLALVLRGALQLHGPQGRLVRLGVGATVGEMGVITGSPRSATVDAGPEGAQVFVLPASAFEEMLQRSSRFTHELLAQLAGRLTADR
jgi:hypothetical protein